MLRSNKPLRLVIDGKPLVDDHFSGVGHYTMSLLQALDEMIADEGDLDVRLAVPAARIPWLDKYRLHDIRPLAMPLRFSTYKRLLVAGKLPKMDRVLGRGVYFFPDFVRWPLASSPAITAVHDLCFVKVPEMVDEANGQFLRTNVRAAAASSDAITALTHTMAAEITDEYGLPDGRVRVVGCAADTKRFYRRSDAEIQKVTRRYGIFGDYLVTVGNIEPRKNQVRLIEAFCTLPADLAERFTLVLVGAGAWKEAEVRERIDAALREGRKIALLLGAVTDADLPALYSGAHASAYVSVYEGFGMPPLESMACGTPVLTGNRSVLPEVTGDAAITADPTDVAAIAAGLETILRLDGPERDDLVTKGRANVARYRWNEAARTLLDTVREVAP